MEKGREEKRKVIALLLVVCSVLWRCILLQPTLYTPAPALFKLHERL